MVTNVFRFLVSGTGSVLFSASLLVGRGLIGDHDTRFFAGSTNGDKSSDQSARDFGFAQVAQGPKSKRVDSFRTGHCGKEDLACRRSRARASSLLSFLLFDCSGDGTRHAFLRGSRR